MKHILLLICQIQHIDSAIVFLYCNLRNSAAARLLQTLRSAQNGIFIAKGQGFHQKCGVLLCPFQCSIIGSLCRLLKRRHTLLLSGIGRWRLCRRLLDRRSHIDGIVAGLRLSLKCFCGGRRLRDYGALHSGGVSGPVGQTALRHKEAQPHNQNQTGRQRRHPMPAVSGQFERTNGCRHRRFLLQLQCQQLAVEVRGDSLPIHIRFVCRLHASTSISAFSLPLARLSRLRTVLSRLWVILAISPVE